MKKSHRRSIRKSRSKSRYRSKSRSKSRYRSKSRSKSRYRSKSRRSKKRNLNNNHKLKLIKIVKSPNKKKKYRAYFSNGKHTDFGAKGYSDLIHHKSLERQKRYLERHKSRENWNDPTTAGALSRYILWNKTSFRESVADYKKRFKL